MQLYYNGFIPFCVYTTYFTLPLDANKSYIVYTFVYILVIFCYLLKILL
ncbi:protein of unknown function [Streptococcus thermophilus]|uniref:Uncharacterized protein n=1 Tax=Streptococcus thermophilus TaxID=1308 RepID=A0AAU9H6G7_STRTR|nr:protein of unknown function [Streptococcus thermophilus]